MDEPWICKALRLPKTCLQVNVWNPKRWQHGTHGTNFSPVIQSEFNLFFTEENSLHAALRSPWLCPCPAWKYWTTNRAIEKYSRESKSCGFLIFLEVSNRSRGQYRWELKKMEESKIWGTRFDFCIWGRSKTKVLKNPKWRSLFCGANLLSSKLSQGEKQQRWI